MKTSFLTILLIISIFQNPVPPRKISNALIKKFPSAINIIWQKGAYYDPDFWTASFILGGKKATATYSPNAIWDESTLEIPSKELNETVKSSIMEDYPKCEILSAIITEDKITTWYKVKIKHGNKILEVSYDYRGMPFPPKQ